MDVTPQMPGQVECEWEEHRGRNDRCAMTKLQPTFRFCVYHARQYRFILQSLNSRYVLGTPLDSIAQIRLEFQNRAPIRGKERELDLLLNAMENVSTVSSGQRENMIPQVRFIDTV